MGENIYWTEYLLKISRKYLFWFLIKILGDEKFTDSLSPLKKEHISPFIHIYTTKKSLKFMYRKTNIFLFFLIDNELFVDFQILKD